MLFTPVLVILLGALGLAAITAYLDYLLIPALLIFLGITVYALMGIKKCKGGDDECKL